MSETSVVIVNERHEVLAQYRPRSTRLPAVKVQKSLAGFSLATALAEQIGLEVFWLLLPDGGRTTLPLMRLQSDASTLPPGYAWGQPHDLTSGPMPEPDLFDRLDAGGESPGEYSWYPMVQDWLRKTLRRLGHELRVLEPWNSSVGNVLIRVSTDGPLFWFKAVRDQNWRDFLVTQTLNDLYPAHGPRIRAVEPSWQAMLLEHVQGTSLAECPTLRRCQSVARKLADVQKRYCRHTEALLRAGATDLRASTLLLKAPLFLERLAHAIEWREGPVSEEDECIWPERMTPSAYRRFIPIITTSQLKELTLLIPALCEEVASFPSSEGLCNVSSFEPRNVILTRTGVVLIDWADACVGWPLAANRSLWHRFADLSLGQASWTLLVRLAHETRWEKINRLRPLSQGIFLADAYFSLARAILYSETHIDEPIEEREFLRFGELLKLTLPSAFDGYQVPWPPKDSKARPHHRDKRSMPTAVNRSPDVQ